MRITRVVIVAAFVLTVGATAVFAAAGELCKVGESIVVERGMTVSNVTVVGGNVTVAGVVTGDIFVLKGCVLLTPTAEVRGGVVIIGGRLVREPGAAVQGGITQVRLPPLVRPVKRFLRGGWLLLLATLGVFALVGILALALLLVALLPRNFGVMVAALNSSLVPMFLWGALFFILIVPVAVLLTISVIGIPLIPLELFFVAVAVVAGTVAAAAFVGRCIFAIGKKADKAAHPLLETAVGIAVIFFISFVPFVGIIIKALLVTAGFGAVVMTRFGTQGADSDNRPFS